MSSIIEPIHVAEIGGKPIRFFKAPRNIPELPFHALDDLFVILDLNREMRRRLLRCAQTNFGRELCTIATASGPTTIGPHCAAKGLLGAAIQVRHDLEALEQAYIVAAASAMSALTDDMPPVAAFEFTMTAARNSFGGES